MQQKLIRVSIIHPFKQIIKKYYQEWLENHLNGKFTKETLRKWIVQSFNSLNDELIRNAFEICGINKSPDDINIYYKQLPSVKSLKDKKHSMNN